MADLLIPLLILFGIVGLALIWALVHMLRDLEPSSDRPAAAGMRPADRAAPRPRGLDERRGGPAAARAAGAARAPQSASSSLPWQRPADEAPTGRAGPAPPSASGSVPSERGGREASGDPPARLWARRDAGQGGAAPARKRRRCSTCGGSGRAIVHGAGGGLRHGPCPDCQA